MTFLDRIAECNRHDLRRYVPLRAGEARIGWVQRERLPLLRAVAPELRVLADAVHLAAPGFAERSAAMAAVVRSLTERGEFRALRGELYPVGTSFGAPPLLAIERAAVPWFGVHAYGVHVNGFVRHADGLSMWIARRARDKPTYPGMLDNMVAGGQPLGISLRDNVVKECGEEAAISPELAARAVLAGAVTYCVEGESGIKPDCMFCYDLELPADFVPRARDGEVEEFHLLPLPEVARLVRDTRELKFNCNLVVIDFLIRHGWLTPEDPDYLEIARGLRQWGGRT